MEVVIGIFLVSLVVLSGITVLIDARFQSEATKKRQTANQYGNLIRSEITATTGYDDIFILMNGNDLVIDSYNCSNFNLPFSCDIFTLTERVEITFIYPDETLNDFQLIKFKIKLFYYDTRFIELEGVLYG
jgi:hypothetical protein